MRFTLALLTMFIANLGWAGTASITLLTPNGGEVWERGKLQTITWSSQNNPGGFVRIELLESGNFHSELAPATNNDENFGWFIPNNSPTGSEYQIRVTSTTTPSATDTSDATFSIVDPVPTGSITITSPNGGEEWERGMGHDITWTSTDAGGFVRVDVLRGGAIDETLSASTNNDNSFRWLIPADQAVASDYKIRVTSTSVAGVLDESDANFSIVDATPTASLTVTSPNGGEQLEQGISHSITWTSTDAGAFASIEILRGGNLDQTLVSGTNNDGSFLWVIPIDQELGSDYKVRVIATSVAGVQDESDAEFSIVAPDAPMITVSSPNGLEQWETGSSQPITWSSENNPGGFVDIELFKGGFFDRTIENTAVNDGSLTWVIPQDLTPGTDYRVRITSTTASAATDLSDGDFSIVEPPPAGTLTLVTPNGGEQWEQGSTHSVNWTSTGSIGAFVRVELFRGGTLEQTLAATTDNDGSFTWDIPAGQTLASDYRIRVTATSVADVQDESDADFSVVPPSAIPSITVLAPNGGEEWERESMQTIEWTSQNDPGGFVKVELLKAGIVVQTLSGETENDGAFGWNVPAGIATDSDYRIRVTSTTTSGAADASDAEFSIVPAPPPGTLTVTSPDGGEQWERASSHNITWSVTGDIGAFVSVEVLRSGVLHQTLAASTDNDGDYLWVIPAGQELGSDYTIRVTATSVTGTSDESDATFSIVENSVVPSITVTSPNGGESWTKGELETTTWTSENNPGSFVKVELLKGLSFVRTLSGETNNDGSFGWNVPSEVEAGTDYRIRVTSTTTPSATDTSDADFSIADSPPDGSLTITTPNGGESLVRGTFHDIGWTTAGTTGGFVRVEVLRSGSVVQTLVGSTNNDGAYRWVIPSNQPLGSDYRVRVTATALAGVADESDADFSIVDSPPAGTITITAPNGGEQWDQGSSHAITWSTTGSTGSFVRIELFRDSTLDRTITAQTNNDGSFTWLIPAEVPDGSNYRVRVTSTSNSSFTDQSDAAFTVGQGGGTGATAGEIIGYLLGQSALPPNSDVNGDTKVNVGDVVAATNN